MADNNMKLSQAEIDALLNQSGPANPPYSQTSEVSFTDDQKDALGEIGNISFGSAATSLSGLLQQRVEITTPTVEVIHGSEARRNFPKPYVVVEVAFTDGIIGTNALAIEIKDAKTIADLMLGGDGSSIEGELNELHLSAVSEAMNQMMGGAATSMSQIFNRVVNISPPRIRVVDLSTEDALEIGDNGWLVMVSFRLKVGNLIDSKIMQVLPAPFASEMLELLTTTMTKQVAATTTTTKPSEPPMQMPNTHLIPTPPEDILANSQGTRSAANVPMDVQVSPTPTVQRPDFTDFSTQTEIQINQPRNLDLLLDVSLNVTVELGRTRKPIREILELGSGSILELDKLAGEPVDILVNNKRIAVGEVVVIDENFGVRVTSIVSPADRVKNLQ
jgi:flagellar motor switch protein FliN